VFPEMEGYIFNPKRALILPVNNILLMNKRNTICHDTVCHFENYPILQPLNSSNKTSAGRMRPEPRKMGIDNRA
jgi:hypothetical protein